MKPPSDQELLKFRTVERLSKYGLTLKDLSWLVRFTGRLLRLLKERSDG